MDDSLILIFVIVGLVGSGGTALVLFHSDPKPDRSTWIVALGVVIASLIVTFLVVVIAINMIYG